MVLDSLVKKTIKRVAIVGCGPGGLAAARALKNEQCFDTITIFERNNHTGGTWKYSPEKNTPPPFPSVNALEVDNTLREPELHSPIYANLHTNLPHSVMCFHDVPFPEDTPLYPSHAHVMDYLSHVAEQENIVSLVCFRTLVENAEFIDEAWHISVLELETDRRYTEKFDALVVATGHYAVPYIPDLPGLKQISENKSIELVHSREYRQPNEYKNKVVFVIGGGSSANDIVREVATVAKKVYQSIRTPTELSRQSISLNPPNVQQVALVKQFSDGAIQLEDNQTIHADVVIFGTGYLYSFPFLPVAAQHLIKTGQKVHALDHFMFYQQNPTLCFLGLPIRVVPLPLMQRQSVVMARYWAGKIPMIPHEGYKQTGGEDDRLEFIMGVDREFDYDERLGAWAEHHQGPLEEWHSTDPVTGRLPDHWKELRKNALALRKQYLGY